MAHVKLNLVWGLPIAPLDPFSAEKGVEAINLLDNAGFQLESPNGWIPQIAPVKSGGMFSDSPIADGATLISGVRANVTETMTLIVASATLETRQAAMTTLNRYAQLCEDFWENDTQIDPVYLEWQAPGSPGSQYALIYTMEVAESDDPFSEPYTAGASRIVITLTREPFWRALPPGDNPKKWYFYTQGIQPGSGYQYDDLSLNSGNDHTHVEDFSNKHEWTPTGASAYLDPISKNYITIPASKIPGDAPALVECHLENLSTPAGSFQFPQYFVGRSIIDQRKFAFNGTEVANAYILNAADGQALGGAAITAGTSATGVLSNGSAVTFNFVQFVTAGVQATPVTLVRFSSIGGVTALKLNQALMQGQFTVFVRAYTTAGATNDVQLWLVIRAPTTSVSDASITLARIPVTVGTTYTLTNMGTLQIPFNATAPILKNGRGVNVTDGWNLIFELQYTQSVVGARTIRMLDIILVPYSGESLNVRGLLGVANVEGVFDNTGYLSHSKSEKAIVYSSSADQVGTEIETRGEFPTLTPNIDNRLHFIALQDFVTSLNPRPDATFRARLNIIPRWIGVRDT